MDHLTERERRLAIIFYFCSGVATILWWVFMFLFPDSRPIFLGTEFSNQFWWTLLLPDLLSALIISTWMIVLLVKRSPVGIAIAWMHAGAQGYAWAIAIGLTIYDPQAYWGLVGMTFSAGCAFAFAIRIQGFSVLWGKFKFKDAPLRSAKAHVRRTILQTVVMWSVFYLVIPGGIALTEILFKTNNYWITAPWRIPVGTLLFILAGLIGIWAGYTVSSQGQGTPLPSDRTRRFVISGPYRYIRNPMAFSSIVQGTAIGIALGSPLVIVYTLIGGVWWDILVRWQEEADLESRFGEQFQKYRATLHCWIPSIKAVDASILEPVDKL